MGRRRRGRMGRKIDDGRWLTGDGGRWLTGDGGRETGWRAVGELGLED